MKSFLSSLLSIFTLRREKYRPSDFACVGSDLYAVLNYRRIAIIDGAGSETTIGLYWADEDSNLVAEIPWPAGWPEWVSPKWAEAKGYEVVFV